MAGGRAAVSRGRTVFGRARGVLPFTIAGSGPKMYNARFASSAVRCYNCVQNAFKEYPQISAVMGNQDDAGASVLLLPTLFGKV